MRRALGLALLAWSTAACREAFAPTPDSLTTWQRTPLPPDPHLAAQAIQAPGGCRPSDEVFPVHVVLQDQRTPSTAAFLLAGGGMTGSCMYSSGASGSGWTSAPPDPMTAAISIDEQGGGGTGEETTTMLGGRIARGIIRVDVALADNTMVTASVGNGHWLAWWPGGVLADRVIATPADGEATVIEWRDGGWSVP